MQWAAAPVGRRSLRCRACGGSGAIRARESTAAREPANNPIEPGRAEARCAGCAAANGANAVGFLLAVSRAIDALNRAVGHTVYWLILAAVLVSAGNAVLRYLFNLSSNAWLELQWYLFSAV